MMQALIEHILPKRVGAAVVAGSSIDDDSSEVDMQGYDSVLFLTEIADSVATGVATMHVEQTDVSGSGYADAVGASAALTCAVNDDLNGLFLAVDVRKPGKRY